MFGKKQEIKIIDIDGKLTKKDVGLAEDSFGALKNAVGKENHCMDDFQSSPTKENLELLNIARRNRTNLMNCIIEAVGAVIENQSWCILKHICGQAMGVQEMIARFSVVGNLEDAIELSKIHKELYLEYLKILGFNETNCSFPTSA